MESFELVVRIVALGILSAAGWVLIFKATRPFGYLVISKSDIWRAIRDFVKGLLLFGLGFWFVLPTAPMS